jgi:hypothetical protein
MYYDKYQSNEWVNIQIEMEEDENSGSIMDEFKEKKGETSKVLKKFNCPPDLLDDIIKINL